MKKHFLIGAISAVFLALLLHPTAADGQYQPDTTVNTLLNLNDLLEEVRNQNPLLRASRLEAQALAHRREQVSTLPDPAVKITYQPYSILTALGRQRSQWSIEQVLPYPGKLKLQGTIADLNAQTKTFESQAFEKDLFLEAKQAYYELYRIQQQERHISAFRNRLESFEQTAAIRYEVGLDVQQAILKTQLERNALSRLQFKLAEQRHAAIKILAYLLNQPTTNLSYDSIEVESLPFIEFDTDELLGIALRERPEVDALRTSAQRMDAEIALARKHFRPDFGLSLTYFDMGRSNVQSTASGRDAVAIGVRLKVPLHRNRLKAQLEEARVSHSEINAYQESLETSLKTEITGLIHQLGEVTQQILLFREGLLPKAETVLETTLNSYTTGDTDYLDLLDAERMLFRLHTDYEDTFATYLQIMALLERALGINTLAELGIFLSPR